MANVTIGGLVSGIDPDTIIEGLLKVQQRQIDQFNSKKTSIETKQTAYQALQTQLVSLRTTAISLANSANNPIESRTVSVSSTDSLVATANARAVNGTYQVKINSVATAHQVASQEFADADSAVTEGTFSVRIGSQQVAEITVDSSNNTVSGLADAINFANVGVSASVVQDSNSSYRLLLTSSKTGLSNQITITNDLADSSGGAVKPVFDFDNPVQQATDASVTLGSGGGALTVTSSTNTVTSLINGVTLNLQSADPTKNINVTVANDTTKAKTAVTDFVTAYNTVLDFIKSQTKYDSESETGAALQGEYSVVSIRNQLQNVLQSIIPGSVTGANRLSALGIVTSDTGNLTVNDTALDNILNGNVSGVASSDLKHLFAIDGKGSNGNISFLYASAKTKESQSPYQVNITKAAERALLTSGNAVAESTVIDESNDTLKINLDGTEYSVNLAHGTYTRDQLADQVESVVNATSSSSGKTLSAGIDSNNKLTLTSDSYGSSSRVTVYASSAVSALGYQGGESDLGVNVEGNFVVNGVVEAATGAGRTLTGNEGNANTEGLQIRVTLSPTQVSSESGTSGTVTVTRGIASRLNALIDGLMNATSGTLTNIGQSFTDQLESIQKQIDNQQTMFDKQKEILTLRFSAMETALANLQTTSNLLGSQLASLNSMSDQSS